MRPLSWTRPIIACTPLAMALVLLVMGTGTGWGAETDKGILVGTITDAETGEPLPAVSIVVKGTVLGSMSDPQGRFRIANIPAGVYSVEAVMVGFKSEILTDVSIISGGETVVHFALQPSPLPLTPVQVTATKRRQSTEESPISVDVLSAPELRRVNVSTLNQALQYTSSVEITEGEIGIRASTGYSQGAGSRVLVLVDGHPAITGDTGGVNWDTLPVEQIESVEIVKGAGSALYGSNALSGVVNIITREPGETPETRVRLSAGLYDEPYYTQWKWTDRRLTFHSIDLSHSRRVGPVGILLFGGRRASDGYQENDDHLRYNASAKVRYALSQGHVSGTFAWAEDDRGEFLQWKSQAEALSIPPERRGDRVYSAKWIAYASLRRALGPKAAVILKVHNYRTHWRHHLRDSRAQSLARRSGVEVRVELFPSKRHALTVGWEGTYDRVQSEMFGNHRAYDLAGYVQDEVKLPPWLTATIGARYDDHWVEEGRREHQLSPKIGLVAQPQRGISLRASAGKGFRAPSVAERFTDAVIAGFRILPNPELKAETASSYEVGVHATLGLHLSMDVAVFRNDYSDMIEPEVVEGGEDFQMANVTRSSIRGIELMVRAQAWRGLVSGELSYLGVDPRDLDTDEDLPYRSRHRVRSSVVLNYGRGQLSLDFRYASRAEKVKVYPNDERVAQYVVDVGGMVNLGKLALSAKVDNLLQYHYTEVERNLAPIRSYTLTLTATM